MLRTYDRSWLRPDLLAGVTVWAMLVPQGLGYATLAGMPAVAGLYAAFGALLAASGNRQSPALRYATLGS